MMKYNIQAINKIESENVGIDKESLKQIKIFLKE